MSDPTKPFCDHCGARIDPPPAKSKLPAFCTAACMIVWENTQRDARLREDAKPNPKALVDLWDREWSGKPVRRIIDPSDT